MIRTSIGDVVPRLTTWPVSVQVPAGVVGRDTNSSCSEKSCVEDALEVARAALTLTRTLANSGVSAPAIVIQGARARGCRSLGPVNIAVETCTIAPSRLRYE